MEADETFWQRSSIQNDRPNADERPSLFDARPTFRFPFRYGGDVPSADRERFYGGDVLCVEPGSEVSEKSSFRVGLSNGIESSKLISIAIDFNLVQGYGDLRVTTVEIKSTAALVGPRVAKTRGNFFQILFKLTFLQIVLPRNNFSPRGIIS